jgi:hypothetical protein
VPVANPASDRRKNYEGRAQVCQAAAVGCDPLIDRTISLGGGPMLLQPAVGRRQRPPKGLTRVSVPKDTLLLFNTARERDRMFMKPQ